MSEARKRKIKANLSNWELGDWPDRMQGLVEAKVEKTTWGTFEIELNFGIENFYELAREIAQESIEAFFEEGFLVEAHPRGLKIDADKSTLSRSVTIPWSKIWMPNTKSLIAMKRWLEQEERGLNEEETRTSPSLETVEDRIIAALDRAILSFFSNDDENLLLATKAALEEVEKLRREIVVPPS